MSNINVSAEAPKYLPDLLHMATKGFDRSDLKDVLVKLSIVSEDNSEFSRLRAFLETQKATLETKELLPIPEFIKGDQGVMSLELYMEEVKDREHHAHGTLNILHKVNGIDFETRITPELDKIFERLVILMDGVISWKAYSGTKWRNALDVGHHLWTLRSASRGLHWAFLDKNGVSPFYVEEE